MAENQVYIPDGWHLKQVQEFAVKMRSGGTPKSDNPNYYNGEIPFVAIDDLTSANKYLEKTQKHITKEGLINSSAWLVPINSLMYSIYATLGVPRINLIEAATNQAILNLIPDTNKITLEFLYYLLLEKRSTILAHSAHTTQSNLNAKVVKELEFVFPKSTTEQTTIANILSKTDQAIANTEALIAKYSRIKTGLMQDLLTKGIDENGNIRTEQTHEFKDSPLGRIPKEWECDYLSSKVQVQGGYAFKSKDFQTEGVQLIRIGNLYNNQLSLNRDPIFLPKEFLKTLPQFILNKGDIILSMTGTAGKRDYGFAVQINIEEKVFLNQRVCKFLFQEAKIDKDFLLNVLHSEFYLTKLYESVTGTKQANLNSDNILEIYVPFPIIDEQKRISNYLLKVDDFISKSKTELTKLLSLKIGLMQDLLTGKVRVKI